MLAATQATTIRVGRLHEMAVTPGWYLYVGGTAWARAGWRAGCAIMCARLHRAALARQQPASGDRTRRGLVAGVARAAGAPLGVGAGAVPGSSIPPMARFGASDCRCPAHLLYLPALPAAVTLWTLLSPSPSAPADLFAPSTGA